MFLDYCQVQRKDTSKPKNTFGSGCVLALNITISRETMSVLNRHVVGLNVVIRPVPVNPAVIQELKDITKMAIREIIAQRILNFCADDAICLRMGG